MNQNGKVNQIKTHDDFVAKMAKIKPSIEVIGQYVNAKTKVRCKCRACGFEWESFPSTLYKGKGCLKCNGTYHRSREDLINDLAKINSTVEIIGKYVNTQVPIDCSCRVCGKKWSARPSKLLQGQGCPNCARKKIGDALRKSQKTFVEEMKTIMPTVDIIGEYKGWDKRILCHCKECGNEFKGIPNNMRKGEGCPECGRKKKAESQRKTHDQFVTEMANINSKIEITGKYLGDCEKIACQCVECKHKWSALPSNLLKGSGCPLCARNQTSFVEKSILFFLQKSLGEENVLPRNSSAIGKEIDIYIPSMNVGIEPGSWFWHKSRIRNDKEKYHVCCEKGIRLITIYDSFTGDKNELGINNEDFITYSNNLGETNRRAELRDCIINIFDLLGLTYTFSEEEECELFICAKKASRRKGTSDIISELATINPNIELLGHYEDSKTKIPCRCKVCGHEWSQNTDHLILRKQGCPMCNRPHKKVINLDTGEMFESATDAASQLGLTPAAIATACRGINKTCNGHNWKYVQDLDK